MRDKTILNKKSLALIIVDSKNENSVVVYSGKINLMNNKLYFSRNGDNLFEITDWQERIKIVKKEVKKILLNCNYYLMLSIADLPEDENPNDYKQTGLKWIPTNE